MKSLTAISSDSTSLGYFRIFATPPSGDRREITIFRNAPVILEAATTTDPFTDSTAQLSLPQVTVFDSPGNGDLDWLVPDCDIDIVFQNTGAHDLNWRWEGYIASMSFSLTGSESSYRIDLKGALYGLDDYLAIPSFPKRPIPYEILISKAFDQRNHPARLGELKVTFPEGWEQRVPEFTDPGYLSFLKPWGVTTGQLWTGFTSRSTGSWEPLLTGHVQSLLTVMFAEGGAQWSVRNNGFRRPELYLKKIPEVNDPRIIEVTLGSPGVSFSGSKDYTQRASVIYGQGVDSAGVSYSGMNVSPDGKTTYFKPFAYNPTVWPRQKNPSYNREIKPKETMIRFQDGVDQLSAMKIAQGQLQRFGEPGITGNLTLHTDVRRVDGTLVPRMLIKAGETIRIKGYAGLPEGLLVHVTQTSANFQDLSISLTVDSKYRDQLTVEEVQARTRDALTPLRHLQVGKYSNTVQDLLLPWSYEEGSGCIPKPSREFFNEKLPAHASFPYEEWTTQYPPSNPAYRNWYIRLNPTNTENSTNNWSGEPRDGQPVMAIPIRMSQAGSIRLTQIAAYDKNGNVLPVKFHFSVYTGNSVARDSMPRFPWDPEVPGNRWLAPEGVTVSYESEQANPFFEGAWEQVDPDGTEYDHQNYLTAINAGLVVGWGNFYEPAGYSPGRFSRGATKTGLLEDTTSWAYNLNDFGINPVVPAEEQNDQYLGMLFVMVYCDEQGDEPVYFMGRLFREEPGA